ncbi:MAG TPA: serine hydrolase [Gemmatimonadaceae bacterium]|nr:serine hydrolase [Gemmatimonadaceae bacterium]
MHARRLVAALAVTASSAAAVLAQTPKPANGWAASTPQAEGLDPAPLRDLVSKAGSGTFGNTDRLVIIRNGKLVLNERFARDYREISRGKTSAIGCGIDACKDSSQLNHYNYLHPAYHPYWQGGEAHTLQSVTKSVTATVIGAAMQQGKIKNAATTTPLLSYFGAYDLSKVDPRLRKATLADLLTMRSGIEWHETDRPLDETNTTLLLERSPDWIRFTLAQPMDSDPGTKWVYNSGGSALMAEVIRASTGTSADDYAKRYVFTPLGITSFHWKRTPSGHPDTEGGLYLDPLDLAKIGQMYMDDGVWRGMRILPAGWAKEATARTVDHTSANPASPGYGYQWWRYDRRGVDIWAGNGFGGQFLLVIPQHRIVAVVNSWNVFGTPATGVLGPMIDAVLDAARVPR